MHKFDVIGLSETILDDTIRDEDIHIEVFRGEVYRDIFVLEWPKISIFVSLSGSLVTYSLTLEAVSQCCNCPRTSGNLMILYKHKSTAGAESHFQSKNFSHT